MKKVHRPQPVPNALTEPFWTATRDKELKIEYCPDCEHYTFPPLGACPRCRSTDVVWRQVSGRGVIFEVTVLRQQRDANFKEAVPFAVVAVELVEQEGLLLIGNVIDAEPDLVKIGMPVTLSWEPLDAGYFLPQFMLGSADLSGAVV